MKRIMKEIQGEELYEGLYNNGPLIWSEGKTDLKIETSFINSTMRYFPVITGEIPYSKVIILCADKIIASKNVVQKWGWSFGKLGFCAAMKGCKIYKVNL